MQKVSAWETDGDGNRHPQEDSLAIAEDPAQLVNWLEATWQMIAVSISECTADDLFRSYQHTWNGTTYAISRQWTVFRILAYYIHHGNVRKAGEKIRISVQLIEAISEEPHWPQKFDREILDIFEIQSEIAEKVAGALHEYVLRQERPVETVRSTRIPEAYFSYLRGRQFWNKRTEEDLKRSIDFFKAALKIDADYARAYAGLGDSFAALALLEFMTNIEAYPKAGEAVRKALLLDPLSLTINTGVGHVLYLSGQYDRAIEEYHRAVELDPNFMSTHVWFGKPYLEKGLFSEAISDLEIAVRLSGESTLALAMLSHGLAAAGRKEEAIHILNQLKERSSRQYVPSY